MGSPDCVPTTMKLNSLIPVFCLLLVSACQGLGLEGLKEQKAREGKKQVGLPCKTIVTEECAEKEVPRFEEVCEWYSEECTTEYEKHCENSRREKRGVLQAVLLTSAIASQNPGTTTEAPASAIRATIGTAIGHVPAEVPLRKTALKCPQGTAEGAGVKVCRKVNLPKMEKACAKVETLVC